jgi:hypothetical protein
MTYVGYSYNDSRLAASANGVGVRMSVLFERSRNLTVAFTHGIRVRPRDAQSATVAALEHVQTSQS